MKNAAVSRAEVQRFKKYPAYKDSGSPWLGAIPAHWEMKRLKAIADVRLSNVDKKSVEGEESVRLCNYTDVYYNDRITDNLEFMQATATREQVRRFALKPGDVLITKDSESWTDIAVSAVVVDDLPDVLCGYHLAHIRPNPEIDGAFLSRAFTATGIRDQFRVVANGITRYGLGSDAIGSSVFAIPPFPEQRAITRFLNHETANIDALVAKKHRVIELLQERRKALIARTTTLGLDQTPRIRASCTEPANKRPAHWRIAPLKSLLRRIDYGISESLVEGGDIRVLTMAHIQDGKVLLPQEGSVKAVESRLVLDTGDLLFNRTNSRDLVAKVGLFTGSRRDHVTFASYLVRMTPKQDVVSEWLNYLLNSDPILGLARSMALLSVNQANLNPTKYTQITLPVPPTEEQRAIASFLDLETNRIDSLIERIVDAIEHLQELRTTLISAAVTGKIDVSRGAI